MRLEISTQSGKLCGIAVGMSFPRKRESREVHVRLLLEVPGCPPQPVLSLTKGGHDENLS